MPAPPVPIFNHVFTPEDPVWDLRVYFSDGWFCLNFPGICAGPWFNPTFSFVADGGPESIIVGTLVNDPLGTCWNIPPYPIPSPPCLPTYRLYPYGTLLIGTYEIGGLGENFIFDPANYSLTYIGASSASTVSGTVFYDFIICWRLAYRRGDGRFASQEGPGRFPARIVVPHEDIVQESAVLVEDGVVIPRSKYSIQYAPKEGY